MTNRKVFFITLSISLLFTLANAILFTFDFYWLLLVPVIFFIGYAYFYALDKILLVIAFATPLSITISDFSAQLGLSLPAEPLLAAFTLLFVVKTLFTSSFDKRIIFHPITIAILINLCWMFITCITSSMPIVSFKFFISRCWFVIPCYFAAVLLFKEKKNIYRIPWLYAVGLAIVVIIVTIKHAGFGFDGQIGHHVMKPFYNDHTIYGAMLAFCIPVIAGFVFEKKYHNTWKLFALVILLILFVGFYLSFSRAAWLSLVISIGLFILIYFKIKVKWIILTAIGLLGLFLVMRHQVIMNLEKNKQDTSTKGRLSEQIQSMSNISTDRSNKERLNRWHAAYSMFKDKPVFGHGPGTYQFVYGGYQHSADLTLMSTNHGWFGTAHSEYLLPLSEEGLLGMLSIIAVFATTAFYAIRVYYRANQYWVKWMSMAIFMSLMTYYIHALLNNFLDTDKASVLFWTYTAMIVAFDIYYTPLPNPPHKGGNRISFLQSSLRKGKQDIGKVK